MGRVVAKFLYGSQSYGLDTPESDRDYKQIEVPELEDLFYERKLNHQLDENNSIWDVRDFCKNLMKANPNALELLFSVEQDFVEEDGEFEKLLQFVRERVGALIRCNWDKFSSAVHGIAWNGIKRNGENPKTISRLVYFYLFWLSLIGENGVHGSGTNGEMTTETWRSPKYNWARAVRFHQSEEENKWDMEFIGHDWTPSDYGVHLLEGDEQKCKEVEEAFKTYFVNYLTLN